MTWQRKGAAAWPKRFLLIAFAAAVLRGLGQALIKAGLLLWPSPYVAGLIGYTFSVATLAATAPMRGGAKIVFNRRGLLWFILVGLLNGGATLTMYVALNYGAVSVVAPTIATYPVFALVFGAILLRADVISARMLVGVMLTVAGVIALLLR
jgi:uncharacterized membrane protein